MGAAGPEVRSVARCLIDVAVGRDGKVYRAAKWLARPKRRRITVDEFSHTGRQATCTRRSELTPRSVFIVEKLKDTRQLKSDPLRARLLVKDPAQ